MSDFMKGFLVGVAYCMLISSIFMCIAILTH